MSELTQKKCVPCEEEGSAFRGEALQKLSTQIKNWTIIKEHHLEKAFSFKDFKESLAFTNKVGDLAEAEGHHPDILLGWGKVKITIWTHAVNGLSENDFILAAKIDQL